TRGHNTIKSFFSSIKENIEIKIEKTSLSRQNKAFLIALFLGDKTFLSDATRKSFSSAGVAHVLALSGMHVATLMSLLLFIFYPLKFIRLHKTRLWICLLIIWGYAFLTSLSPSTIRASLMLSFYIAAISFQRKKESVNALLGALFIILLLEPSALYDVGLQLSFVCVAVILCFVGKFNTVNCKHHPFLYYINALILTSVIVSLGTWPIISYYFGSVPLLFLPANLLIVPILPIYMALGLIYIGLVAIGWEPFILTCCLDYIYIFFSNLTSFVSSFPFAAFEISVSGPMVFLWLAGLASIVYVIYADKKQSFMYIPAVFLIILIIAAPLFSPSPQDMCIIQNYSHKISLALYQDTKEHLIVFPAGKISSLIIGNNVIISVDTILETREAKNIFNDIKLRDKQKYLVIGKNHHVDSLTPVIHDCDIKKIIIHPGMRKKNEEKLIKELNTYSSELTYSLREEGPFEINL
ncbi:MAG: ComEC/Rec2 family competence protein, partial [Muribaculaceae bacterium]|nr:ComEC/Rec2 family competence protein [Muribaculaceae bacterium]